MLPQYKVLRALKISEEMDSTIVQLAKKHYLENHSKVMREALAIGLKELERKAMPEALERNAI
jgi:hypothetical protein